MCIRDRIKIKQKQKVKKFESQLSDALIIACSCLKSGLSFSQAMETISKDMDAPISSEFALVIKEMSMGSSMEEACLLYTSGMLEYVLIIAIVAVIAIVALVVIKNVAKNKTNDMSSKMEDTRLNAD